MIQILANNQELEIDIQKGVNCLIPAPGMKIQVPGFFEINGRTTIDCCEALAEDKAGHILNGGLYAGLFAEMFETQAPTSKSELLGSGEDVQHITGMIILVFEAMTERGERVFLRTPETHLHPQQSAKFMGFLTKLIRVCENIKGQKPEAA